MSKRHENARKKSSPQSRRRAYELYEQRGYVDGNDLDDWLAAESKVLEPEHNTASE
jgi:Protein of unknown function (DUF2934)